MKKMYLAIGALIVVVLGFVVFSQMKGNKKATSSSTTTSSTVKKDKKVLKIGLLQPLSHPSLDAITKGTIDQLAKRGYVDGKNIKLTKLNAQGDSANLKSMAEQLNQGDPDLNIAIATPAAQALANVQKTTPLVIGAISSPVQSGLVKSMDKPGGNIAGTSNQNPTKDQLDLIFKMMPKIKKLGFIYKAGDVSSQSTAAVVKEYFAKSHKDVELKTYTITNANDLDQVSGQMASAVDAVYVPQDNTIAGAFTTLLKNTNAKKVPVFPTSGDQVKEGALATVGQNQYQIGVVTGNLAADVLEGKVKPGTDPIKVIDKGDLTINLKVAKSLGITVPQSLIDEAEKIKGNVIK